MTATATALGASLERTTAAAHTIARALVGYDDAVSLRISSSAVSVHLARDLSTEDRDAVWSHVCHVIGARKVTCIDDMSVAVGTIGDTPIVLTTGRVSVEVLP